MEPTEDSPDDGSDSSSDVDTEGGADDPDAMNDDTEPATGGQDVMIVDEIERDPDAAGRDDDMMDAGGSAQTVSSCTSGRLQLPS